MNKRLSKHQTALLFGITLALIIICFIIGILKTDAYNKVHHIVNYKGSDILSFGEQQDQLQDVSMSVVPRSDTWSKAFDLNNEGITEHNYEAHTFDITIANNTNDAVSDFVVRIGFTQDVFLASAWNGAVEIHQHQDGKEVVDTVSDMREYVPSDHCLNTFSVDGETFIHLKSGDYIVYLPSSSMNAMEIPIKPSEGTTPGLIMYLAIGENLADSTFELNYTFHRLLTSEPLFWISITGLVIWLLVAGNYAYITSKLKAYNERHERDNKIINESIETFTGFIDAKDPYTNGHSKRVAEYTRLIAKEMGFEGDELERLYYVALLHDCGKIGVPDKILRKPGKLTDEEFEIIKSHTVKGGDILKSFKSLENAGEGALYHHERYDGKGYPEGLAGENIPLIARIICVADSFDAMNTDRVYRKKLPMEKILNEIEKNKGLQFDPAVADIMLRLLKAGMITNG